MSSEKSDSPFKHLQQRIKRIEKDSMDYVVLLFPLVENTKSMTTKAKEITHKDIKNSSVEKTRNFSPLNSDLNFTELLKQGSRRRKHHKMQTLIKPRLKSPYEQIV